MPIRSGNERTGEGVRCRRLGHLGLAFQREMYELAEGGHFYFENLRSEGGRMESATEAQRHRGGARRREERRSIHRLHRLHRFKRERKKREVRLRFSQSVKSVDDFPRPLRRAGPKPMAAASP